MAPKKTPTTSNKFDGVFSDSDDDNEVKTDIIEDEIKYRVQEKTENIIRSFKQFMDNPEFITPKGDANTNIVDRHCLIGERITARTYNIPHDKVDKMFKYLEVCRRKSLNMMVYERQLEYSGFMIDFDILQSIEESSFNEGIARAIVLAVAKLLIDHLDFDHVFGDGVSSGRKYTMYTAIIKKPRVMYNSDKKCFKDGFHILVPGIKINRETKRLLINKAKAKGYFNDIFQAFAPADGLSPEDFIDSNSAHVPVHFLGSTTKPGQPAYYLFGVYTYDITPNMAAISPIINKCDLFDDNKIELNTILCHELSLNWEKKGGIIKKCEFRIKDQFVQEAKQYKTQSASVDDFEDIVNMEHGELSLLKIHDPEVEYIISLIDTLNPTRAMQYMPWFKVLRALACTNKSYKPIAEYFSKKCPEKYSASEFESYWNLACSNKGAKISMGSIIYWAMQDNPERFESIKCNSTFDILFKKIYDVYNEGQLQHYDVAEVLFKMLRHKYVFDSANGGKWYEFITPDEPHKKGELYKWRAYGKSPLSIKRYISEILPTLFRKVLDKITHIIETQKADKDCSYHTLVKRNTTIVSRNLKQTAFKNCVVHEAEQLFEKIGFGEMLDKDKNIIGVGNGIILLDKECKLITGYHDYLVSKYTTVDYKPFNPNDPTTKKLLYALRNLFPDDEPDTFDFMMHYFASALDAKPKESMIMFLVGNGSNGKSFLVELFKETIGSMFAVKLPLAFLTTRQKNPDDATSTIMMLMDARFVFYSESEKSELLHVAKIKEVTGQETLGGRKLYGDYMTFKPNCHHLVTSNYDFEINSNQHAIWRRLFHVTMKIKFCKKSEEDFDEKSPYERLADPSMCASWPDDDDIKSAFLGLLVYYYESLHKNYDGIVTSVPHPNIKRETMMFRNRQDKINNFIGARVVRTVDSDVETPMTLIIEKYGRWHESLYPDDREYKKSIILEFENSCISKLIIKSKTGNYIKGYRVLDNNEQPEEDETYLVDDIMDGQLKKTGSTIEPSDQYFNRMCREHEVYVKEKMASEELEKKRIMLLSKEVEHRDVQPIIEQKNTKKPLEETKYDDNGYRINRSSAITNDKELMDLAASSDDDDSDLE